MTPINLGRRDVLAAGAAAALAVAGSARSATATATLDEALRLRRSTRAFQAAPIDEETLGRLAWAAQGVNRPDTGLRTVPSWHGAADTRLHVADTAGVRLYDPVKAAFGPVAGNDIRAKVSPQPFVATAPVVLIFTSDVASMPTDAPFDQKKTYALVDAAMVSQNVYLFCAARGLGTCLVGGIDAAAISTALGLAEGSVATFVQPVGWPA